MQTDSLAPPLSLAVALQAGESRLETAAAGAQTRSGGPPPWAPRCAEPRDASFTGGGGAGGRPGSAAAPASRHPHPVPKGEGGGEEQLMGTCDFLHQ